MIIQLQWARRIDCLERHGAIARLSTGHDRVTERVEPTVAARHCGIFPPAFSFTVFLCGLSPDDSCEHLPE